MKRRSRMNSGRQFTDFWCENGHTYKTYSQYIFVMGCNCVSEAAINQFLLSAFLKKCNLIVSIFVYCQKQTPWYCRIQQNLQLKVILIERKRVLEDHELQAALLHMLSLAYWNLSDGFIFCVFQPFSDVWFWSGSTGLLTKMVFFKFVVPVSVRARQNWTTVILRYIWS